MNKLELAHDYAKIMLKISAESGDLFLTNTDEIVKSIVSSSFNFAEAMLAENEKRKDKSQPEAIQNYEPDWNQAPDWANWWGVDEDGQSHWYDVKPDLDVNEWAMGLGADDYSKSIEFSQYTGDWQNSLRKRP